MTDARWQRVIDLFHAALARDADGRDAFLKDACAGDDELYREVSSLVEADAAHKDGALEAAAQAAAASWAGRDTPSGLIGRRIGRYLVVAHLGSGGMGDVYRATDTALGRDVALKLLGARLHADATLRRRLEVEARAASSLNHPNIVTVHEIGQADGFDFVVSELVEGETLRDVITRGASTLGEVVDVCGQVAAALAAAHAAGIVHRDIKPENVIVRRDGLVKVVDFGLAKSAWPHDTPPEQVSPHHALTLTGAVAGTAYYMSPEQALGEKLDHRSDLFALGVVLYEMTTGRRPFSGASDAALYDALLHASPPPPSSVRSGLPAAVDAVIGRALEKDRTLRYQSAQDLAADLKRLQRPLSGSPLAAVSARRDWRRPALLAAAAFVLVAAVVAAAAVALRSGADRRPAVRFTIGPPPHAEFTLIGTVIPAVTLAVSPDGRRVIYLAGESSARGRLWIRSLDALDAVPLDGTEGATFPFWSPDGASVGFFADGALRVKDIAGGTPRTVVMAPGARGGTWNRVGIILFGNAEGPVYQVPAAGGTPTPVTTLDAAAGESWHRFPQFLPDDVHFFYLARAGDTRTLMVGSLSGSRQRVIETAVRGTYAPPGYVLTVEDDSLIARPFDTRRLAIVGEPTPIAPYVATSSANDASFGVSANGVLVYAGRAPANSQLTWFDRTGRALGTTGTPSQYLSLRLSPDEKTVAVARASPGERAPDIWLLDVQRNAESRFTFNKWLDETPVWSPDGHTILFSSSRTGLFRLYTRAAQGGAEERLFFKADQSVRPEEWSADGKYVIYGDPSGLALLDVATLRTTPLLGSRFRRYEARLSPDGHWLAYTSDEAGRPEVYVQPFPAGGATTIISTAGGSEPSWRRDGREIFFIAADGALMAVDVGVKDDSIAVGAPHALFRVPMPAALQRDGARYAASGDGRRFLVNALVAKESTPAITVVVDWPRDVRQ